MRCHTDGGEVMALNANRMFQDHYNRWTSEQHEERMRQQQLAMMNMYGMTDDHSDAMKYQAQKPAREPEAKKPDRRLLLCGT